MPDLQIKFVPSLFDVAPEEWNALNSSGNPFLQFEFLASLEESGSVSVATGWQPSHMLIYNSEQQLVAAIPSYIKQHSYGEYVFDWSWADAYNHYGEQYYPKLLSAIPFTPSVGPRLLTNTPDQLNNIASLIIETVKDASTTHNLSSWHLLFPDAFSLNSLANNELMKRVGCQFQWHNENYESFDHFLDTMTSRKRKSIRKERNQVQDQGIRFVQFEGTEITPAALEKFYLFYHATYLKRGQQGYLNQLFFEQLVTSMPENLLLVMAEKDGEYVAGALSLKDHKTLYGRYWGCLDEYKQLHFETCYYQGIDYCIQHKLKRFDAGAQGEHKIQRGFVPTPTYSLHWIKSPTFTPPIKDFIQRESEQVEQYTLDAKRYLPFKKQY
jgi:predicted N-acyltransferase